MNKEFLEVLNQIEKEKRIPKERLLANLKEAITSAYKKSFGSSHNAEVDIDSETGKIKITSNQAVVEGPSKPGLEITLADARKIKPGVKAGDKIDVDVPLEDFGRIATQVAKQVIMQRIREEERVLVYQDFKPKEKNLLTGEVRHKDARNNYLLDIGGHEAILPVNEQVKTERLNLRDRVKVFLLEVKRTSKGPVIYVSRTHPELLKRLFELEIPEIHEGVVEIKGIVREPGTRAKVAVFSNNEKVDPLGACVGMKGLRIQAIAREMGVEKIDLVRWNEDIGTYILNSLSPAKSQEIHLDKDNKRATILLEDEQLKLAIGKKGQNVRLASRLTGWQIDLRKREEIVSNLTSLPGVGESTAGALMEAGIRRIEDLAKATPEQLTEVKGLGDKKAENLIDAAKRHVQIAKSK